MMTYSHIIDFVFPLQEVYSVFKTGRIPLIGPLCIFFS